MQQALRFKEFAIPTEKTFKRFHVFVASFNFLQDMLYVFILILATSDHIFCRLSPLCYILGWM